MSSGVPSPLSKVEASGQWLERPLQGKEANNEVRLDCEVPAVDGLDPTLGSRGWGFTAVDGLNPALGPKGVGGSQQWTGWIQL